MTEALGDLNVRFVAWNSSERSFIMDVGGDCFGEGVQSSQ